MMKKHHFSLSLIFACLLSLAGIASGSWILKNEKKQDYSQEPTDAQKVAYTQSTNSDGKIVNTYYTSLAKAISKTKSGTIYVIPGTNPTLTEDATILSGVTLSLPYEDDLNNTHTVEDAGRTSEGDFADYVEYSTKGKETPTVFCKSNVTIADGVTLTNNGNIFVGGVLGRNGQVPTGMTVGNYSKITMGSGSKISNIGTITSYGFIKEKENIEIPASVVSSQEAKLNLPIIIYDYRGGSFSSYAAGALRVWPFNTWKAMPFNVFDFPNVQCDVYFSGNSVLNGTITVYASSSVVTSSAALIGPSESSSLIRLTSGTVKYRYRAPLGYVYDDYAQGTPEKMINRTKFTVNGNVNIASMKIDVGVSIDTSEFHLPFSYKFAFDFESGKVDISNKIKFLAGCVFQIGKSASVNVNAETVFYEDYVPAITTGRGDGYPRYTKSSTLINNGALTINSNFGGIVNSSSESAKTITGGNFSGKVNTTEALTGETGGIQGTNQSHDEEAKFTLINQKRFDANSDILMNYVGPTQLNQDLLEKNKQYTSESFNNQQNYGWVGDTIINTYGIRYVLNDDTVNNPNTSKDSFIEGGDNVQLDNLTNNNSSHVFDGFYYDESLSTILGRDSSGKFIVEPTKAINYLQGLNHIKVYAKWITKLLKELSIVYSYRNPSTYEYVDTSAISLTVDNETLYTISAPNEAISFEKVIKEGVSKRKYELTGWHLEINGQKSSSYQNGAKISWNDIEAYGASGTLRIVADYQEAGYLRMTINNASWEFFGTQYVIRGVKIKDVDVLNQSDIYVCPYDKIYIEVYNRKTGASRCDVKINGETVLDVNKTKKEFYFKDYSNYVHYFDEGQYGIVLQGNS